MSELEYSLSVENIQISLYAHARQSLLLLTQGNIYNRLRFLNKYLMLLEELNELFRETCSNFLNAGYLVFWKKVPGCRVSRHELDYFHNYYWVMAWISAASLPKWLDLLWKTAAHANILSEEFNVSYLEIHLFEHQRSISADSPSLWGQPSWKLSTSFMYAYTKKIITREETWDFLLVAGSADQLMCRCKNKMVDLRSPEFYKCCIS